MAREILFKAKRVDSCEWVEGNFITNERDESKAYIGYLFDVRNGKIEDFDIVEVIPNTLCQYTGLTDKNGNKIWENDIVVHSYTTYEEEPQNYPPIKSKVNKKNYVIKWDSTDSYCGYRYHNGRNIFPFKKGTVFNGNDEVIGNIFDNPELLGGGE